MQNQSVAQNSQISNLSPNEFDYTFTDKELQDILGFMEHQAGGQDAAATSVPPPFLSAPPPSSLGLQFQPHSAPVQSGSTVAARPYDQNNTAGVKGEAASSSTGFVPTFGSSNGLPLAGGHPGTRSNAYNTNSMHLLDRRSSLQPIQGTATNRQDRGQKAASCTSCIAASCVCDLAEGMPHYYVQVSWPCLQNHDNTLVIALWRNNEEIE